MRKDRIIHHHVPLRDDLDVVLSLPANLTAKDAKRLKALLMSLVVGAAETGDTPAV